MVNCVRCNVPLEFQGVKEVREDRRREMLSDALEGVVYVCPRCGTIELFDSEVGKDLRTDNPLSGSRA